jgi:hypothetical protein
MTNRRDAKLAAIAILETVARNLAGGHIPTDGDDISELVRGADSPSNVTIELAVCATIRCCQDSLTPAAPALTGPELRC